MKFTILLLLLCLTQTTSVSNNLTTEPLVEVWIFTNACTAEKVTYNAENKLHHYNGYIFIYIQDSRYEIMYWLGDKLTEKGRAHTIAVVAAKLNEVFVKLPSSDVYVTRKPSDSIFQKFGDLLSVNETKKIPRLYDVAGAHIINQVKIISLALNTMNSYVLYDGCAVTVHHTQSKDNTKTIDDIKKKTAEAFAKYIVKFEKTENTSMSCLNNTDEYFKADKMSFVRKILQTVSNNSQSKSSKAANYERTEFSYFGSKECKFKNEFPRLNSLKSKCIYIIDEYKNGEYFMYFGKKTIYAVIMDALDTAEEAFRKWNKKLTFLVEGNPLPPAFMINVKSEVKKLLMNSSRK